MEDAGIAYTDVRYDFEEYPKYKTGKIAEMNPTATIPIVELDGKILTQSYAIVRHWARQLGTNYGESEDEKHWADAIYNIAIDCEDSLPRAPSPPSFIPPQWVAKEIDCVDSDGILLMVSSSIHPDGFDIPFIAHSRPDDYHYVESMFLLQYFTD